MWGTIKILLVLARSGIIIDFGKRHKIHSLVVLSYILAPIISWRISFGRRGVLYDEIPDMIVSLGPLYVKIVQSLSVRTELLGPKLSECFANLQDKVPPFDSSLAMEIIKSELHIKDINDIFEEFYPTVIASASVAQVYKGRLREKYIQYDKSTIDREVAIKILRPNVYVEYANNIHALRRALRVLAMLFSNNIFHDKTKNRLFEAINILERTMVMELDLLREAAAADELRINLKHDPDIIIPRVHWNLCTEHVMLTEWIDGTSVYDVDKLVGVNKSEIARKVAVSFFNQAYRDGYFHADLHPGNILLTKNGKICLLDCGIMGYLSQDDRLTVAKILHYFSKHDYMQVAHVHVKSGYVPPNTDVRMFARACRAVVEPMLHRPTNEISLGRLLGRLLKMTGDFGMEPQPQLMLLQKTMIVVEGIGRILDPEINMWILAKPWITEWAKDNMGPKAEIIRHVTEILEKIYERAK